MTAALARRLIFTFTALAFSAHVVDHVLAGQELDPLFAGAIGLALLMVAASLLPMTETARERLGAVAGGVIIAGSVAFHILPAASSDPDPTHVTGLIALAGAVALTVAAGLSLLGEILNIRIIPRGRYVR